MVNALLAVVGTRATANIVFPIIGMISAAGVVVGDVLESLL